MTFREFGESKLDPDYVKELNRIIEQIDSNFPVMELGDLVTPQEVFILGVVTGYLTQEILVDA